MALIKGDNGPNLLGGTAGDDAILGFDGDDELAGGEGNDLVDGGAGNDLLGILLEAGPVELGDDVYAGGPGDDRIGAGVGRDTIYGGPGNDVILADASLIRGIDGSPDWISGGPGSDTIRGGPGVDVAYFELPRRAYLVQPDFGTALYDGATVTLGRGPDAEIDSLLSVETVQFVDGRLVTMAEDPLFPVYLVYQAALDRVPDPIGLNGWAAQLAAGLPREVFASAMIASPEFAARFGGLDDAGFVQQLFQNVLDRPGEAVETAPWQAELAAGASRGIVLADFTRSYWGADVGAAFGAGVWDQDEHAAQVARLYDTLLDRVPDLPGFLAHKGALDAGQELEELARGMASSLEFAALSDGPGATPDQLVQLLYANALNRFPEQQGSALWTDALERGDLTREQVIVGISESLEHQILALPVIEGGITFT
jgi:hypothetical protein